MADNIIRSEDGIEVYENGIHTYLDEYLETHDVKDMHKEPQSRWNAALLYINKCMFKPHRDILRADNYDTGKLIHNNSTNNNAYDLDVVNRLCDIYIDLCYEYDKEVSILGFSKLTGINPDTFYDWGNESSRPGSSGCEIYKKLNREREESLSNKLISGKQNPVGLLGALNRHYGWNMGQPRGTSGEQRQSLEQIQERYRLEHGAGHQKPELPEVDFS